MLRCVSLLVLGIVFQLSNGIEFNVTQDGTLCLYANLKLEFSVDYEDLDGQTQRAVFLLPDDAKSDASTCDETLSELKLNFGEGNSWSVTFSKIEEAYEADMITFTYNLGDPVHFPNSKSKDPIIVTSIPDITNVVLDTCYSCQSKELIRSGAVSMTLSDVLVQAFISDGFLSSSITACAADQSVTSYSTTAPTTAPTTTTPTTAPTTAPNATTPTTTAPTTAPNATTPTTAPTTAPNATTPTTAPNSTIPTPTSSTTPATTALPPLPIPTTGNYSIKTDNNTVCLLANFGLRVGPKKGKDMNFDPIGATVSGSCGVNTTELILESKDMTINFTFINDTKKFRLHALSIISSGLSAENTNLSLWEAAIGSSYMCNKEQTFNVTDTLAVYTFNLHVQPFAVQKGVFSTADECFLDSDLSFLVPIAVGVALSFLIILVLISYLIGRRKSRTGYQSV